MTTSNDDVVTSVPETRTKGERLARAREAKALREARAAEKAEEAEIERCALVERFENELHGEEGQAFNVVDLTKIGEGFVVVKLGTSNALTTVRASKQKESDIAAFVTPWVVHPAVDEFKALVARRIGILNRVGDALVDLYGLTVGDTEKK